MTGSPCGHENAPGQRFCATCGAPLTLTCSKCGTLSPAGQSFCGACGEPFSSPAVTTRRPYTPRHLAEKILRSRGVLEGERKHVTVLFADLVESSALAERLAPEAMYELADAVLRMMADAVHRYDGTVNQFLGDGIMALFGAPVALEDHAVRASMAAFAILHGIERMNETVSPQHGVRLRIRIGLNTGPVVVGKIGDDLRMDYTAVGDTTHLAARMQALAAPDTIVAAGGTHRFVRDYVRSESLGSVRVKGRAEPSEAYRLLSLHPRTRFEVGIEHGLTTLVGRGSQLDLLRDRLEQASAGRGQVVGIVGEPGVGKSRLVYEFCGSLRGQRIAVVQGRCVPHGATTPYLPVLEILRTAFQIADDEQPVDAEAKLRRSLMRLDEALLEVLPCLRDVLGFVGGEPPASLDPRLRRQKNFEALRALAVTVAQRQPLVVVLEDLHWIDRTSEDYFDFLIDALAGVRIVILATFRQGYRVRWHDKPYYAQLGLDLLDEDQTEELLRGILQVSALPSDLARFVYARAAGNPLFTEQFAHSLVERGALARRDGEITWHRDVANAMPETVGDIIRARIDALDEGAKRTAQAAAVIGRRFSSHLVARVVEEEAELSRHLSRLKDLSLIREDRVFPDVEYVFEHAIIQDVVYETLLTPRRAALHGAIGAAIEDLYADRLADHYGMLAFHFLRADQRPRALMYLVKAADRAAAAFANREAFSLYEEALALLPAATSRDRAAILKKLATVAWYINSDACLRYATAALETHEDLDDTRAVIDLHLQISLLYTSGFWDGAREDHALGHLEAAAALVESDPDSREKRQIYRHIAHVYLHRGRPDQAREWALRAVEISPSPGTPPVVRGWPAGVALAYTGRVDDGVHMIEAAWADALAGNKGLVEPIPHPVAVAALGHELLLILALLRNVPKAMAHAETILAEVTKRSRHNTLLEGFVKRPLALVYSLGGKHGRAEELREAVEALESRTFMGCIFEDAAAIGFHLHRTAAPERAAGPLERRLAVYEERNNRAALGGCAFALGLVRMKQRDLDSAEALLLRSLEIARGGGNQLFELWILPALAELYVATKRLPQADAALQRAFGLMSADQDWCALPAPVHFARGLAAIAGERWDEADTAFRAAADLNRRYDLPWDEARALFHWGSMQRMRGQVRAAESLRRAHKLFTQVGAVDEARRAEAAAEGGTPDQ